MNTQKPTRDQLQMVFKDHRLVIAFESLFSDTAESIPSSIDDLSLDVIAAESKAVQALDSLTRIADALEMIATAPTQIQLAQSEDFSPQIQSYQKEDFSPASQTVLGDEIVANQIIQLPEPVYGEAYATNTTITVVVAAINTAYEVTTGLTGGLTRLMTFGGSHYLQVDRGGTYLVTWSMTIDTNTAADEVEGGIMIDGVAQSNGTSHTTVSVANDGSAIAASALFTLNALQQISFFIRNHTGARDIIVEHVSLTAVLIRS